MESVWLGYIVDIQTLFSKMRFLHVRMEVLIEQFLMLIENWWKYCAALAIEDIEKKLNLTEWTGDPCLPTPHSWIGCIPPDVTTPAPQITSMQVLFIVYDFSRMVLYFHI